MARIALGPIAVSHRSTLKSKIEGIQVIDQFIEFAPLCIFRIDVVAE